MVKSALVALALPALASAFMPGAAPSLGLRSGVPAVASTSASRRQGRPALKMVVKDITSEAEFDEVIANTAADKLVVIDYSTTWCGPCKVMAPKFDDFSDKYTDAVFLKCIGDQTPEATKLMKREGIRSVPAFHFWKGGAKIEAFAGSNVGTLESIIKENV